MDSGNARAYVGALIKILASHNPANGDLSFRIEGTFQAITALAGTTTLGTIAVNDLGAAIVRVCKVYNQSDTIGRGETAKDWPNNRFAQEALKALGIPKPLEKAA